MVGTACSTILCKSDVPHFHQISTKKNRLLDLLRVIWIYRNLYVALWTNIINLLQVVSIFLINGCHTFNREIVKANASLKWTNNRDFMFETISIQWKWKESVSLISVSLYFSILINGITQSIRMLVFIEFSFI